MKIWLDKFLHDKTRAGTRFRTGIVLVLISFPVGFSSSVFGGAISQFTSKRAGIYTGLGIYIFSWILFAIGIWMAEKKGVILAKEFWTALRGRKS